jgi:hypothetical protein
VLSGSKTASVFSKAELAKKMHVKFNNEPRVLFNVPDSMIRKYGKLSIDSSDRQLYKLTFLFKKQQVSKVVMVVSKINYSLISISFEIPELKQLDPAHDYAKIMSIYNIHYDADPSVFNLDRIFTVEGKNITLSTRYTKYKLETLTN